MSGRDLCDGWITRPEKFYRLWRVVVCDQETSKSEEAKARYWVVKIQQQWIVTPGKQTNKYYNLMGPPSNMPSVVDRNLVMRRIPLHTHTHTYTHTYTHTQTHTDTHTYTHTNTQPIKQDTSGSRSG
jgi:hypothetical protein